MSKSNRGGATLKLQDAAVGVDAVCDGDGTASFPKQRVGDFVKHGSALGHDVLPRGRHGVWLHLRLHGAFPCCIDALDLKLPFFTGAPEPADLERVDGPPADAYAKHRGVNSDTRGVPCGAEVGAEEG